MVGTVAALQNVIRKKNPSRMAQDKAFAQKLKSYQKIA